MRLRGAVTGGVIDALMLQVMAIVAVSLAALAMVFAGIAGSLACVVSDRTLYANCMAGFVA